MEIGHIDMDLDLTSEQRLVVDTAREYARRELAPRAAWRDQTGTFPVAELRALADLGLLGVNIPSALGGAEAGAVAYALAMEEIARADAAVAVAMAVTNMVGEVVTRYGSEAQRQRAVTRLCSGEAVAGAFALSEPQAGSDPGAMTARATRTAEGWRLDGTKQWITSGDRAGVMVVWARTDSPSANAGTRGISAFLVETQGGALPAGLVVGRHEDKMGLRGSSTVPLIFDGVLLGPDALLGKEGDGFKIAMTALDGGRIGIAAQACGVAVAALEASIGYVKQRQQFGRPLADFQNTQFRIADMATELDAARLLVGRAAWRKQEGRGFTREASIAKLYASEMAGRVADAAVQLHGGYGYTREFPVERAVRDARVQRIYEGTSEIQRLVIAREWLRAQG